MAEPYSSGPQVADNLEENTSGLVGDSAYARDVAEYLGDMIRQLEAMAQSAGMDLLVYLLAMARSEAEAHARGLSEPRRVARR